MCVRRKSLNEVTTFDRGWWIKRLKLSLLKYVDDHSIMKLVGYLDVVSKTC